MHGQNNDISWCSFAFAGRIRSSPLSLHRQIHSALKIPTEASRSVSFVRTTKKEDKKKHLKAANRKFTRPLIFVCHQTALFSARFGLKQEQSAGIQPCALFSRASLVEPRSRFSAFAVHWRSSSVDHSLSERENEILSMPRRIPLRSLHLSTRRRIQRRNEIVRQRRSLGRPLRTGEAVSERWPMLHGIELDLQMHVPSRLDRRTM